MKTLTYLSFDQRVSYGSAEHFFHFMWGYLLPSVYLIYASTELKSTHYILRSCGPVMDKIMHEVMQLCDFNYTIAPEVSIGMLKPHTHIIVPRWDIGLLHSDLFYEHSDPDELIVRMRDELSLHDSIRSVLKSDDYLSVLSEHILQTKFFLESKISLKTYNTDLARFQGSYLLLARSTCPNFYEETGNAKISGYGVSRRALLGIEEVEKSLRKKNISIQVFEPGKYSFTDQARVFQQSKGVIGIEGAEFANLLWLKPVSDVIFIKPTVMKSPPVLEYLADILGQNSIPIEDNQGYFPVLKSEQIVEYLIH